jgi:hypothetical protein
VQTLSSLTWKQVYRARSVRSSSSNNIFPVRVPSSLLKSAVAVGMRLIRSQHTLTRAPKNGFGGCRMGNAGEYLGEWRQKKQNGIGLMIYQARSREASLVHSVSFRSEAAEFIDGAGRDDIRGALEGRPLRGRGNLHHS